MPTRIERPISGIDVLRRLMARLRDSAPARTVSFGHGLFVPTRKAGPAGCVRQIDTYDLYTGAVVLRPLPTGLRTWVVTTCERNGDEDRPARSLRLELFALSIERDTPDAVLRAAIGCQLMQPPDHRLKHVPNTLLWTTELGRLHLSPVPFGARFRRLAGSACPERRTHPGPDGSPPPTYPVETVGTFERALKGLMGFEIN